MSREIPKELYDQVFHLVDDIVQAHAPADAVDETRSTSALIRLRALFEKRDAEGAPDPFLTEAMADFTEDDAESARLYALSIAQAASVPDEPLHTKHLGLAERLNALGRSEEAAAHLEDARRGAFREGETRWMQAMDELKGQLRPSKSLERTRD